MTNVFSPLTLKVMTRSGLNRRIRETQHNGDTLHSTRDTRTFNRET